MNFIITTTKHLYIILYILYIMTEKILWLNEDVHSKIKVRASKKKLTMKKYVEQLVNKDELVDPNPDINCTCSKGHYCLKHEKQN